MLEKRLLRVFVQYVGLKVCKIVTFLKLCVINIVILNIGIFNMEFLSFSIFSV